jgi:hypothetical protein
MAKTYAVVDTDTGRLLKVTTKDPEIPNSSRKMTHFAFMKRLTAEERITITSLEESQPLVRDWVKMFTLADEVNLDDPDLIQGLYGLEQMGVLAPGRAAEVLA